MEPCTRLVFARPKGIFTPAEPLQTTPEAHCFDARHLGTVDSMVSYTNEPLNTAQDDSSGSCWQSLFQHCIIASGYPFPARRSERPGLEIPFDMMAALAGTDRITPFGDHLLLKGFSALLFPSASDDDCIFWHLIPTHGNSRISFTDERIPLESQIGSHANIEQIHQARHIVGWAENVKHKIGQSQDISDGSSLICRKMLMLTNLDIMKGCMDAKYNIDPSRLSEPKADNGFVLEKVTFTAGYYITMGSTFARGKREFDPIATRDGEFGRDLEKLKERFVILHDVKTRTAWLSDGLSVLLHLVRAYINYNTPSTSNTSSIYGERFFLRQEHLIEMDGQGGRAFETLTNEANLGLRARCRIDIPKMGESMDKDKGTEQGSFICLGNIAKDIMHILWQILDTQADSRDKSAGYKLRLSPWSQLEGFDFRDVAKLSGTIKSKETTLRRDAEGWVDLTRALDAPTLFGRDFGQLFEPRELPSCVRCNQCHWNCSVPKDRDILAVSGSDIEWITHERGDKAIGQWRILNNLYLDGLDDSFSKCLHCSQTGTHATSQQRILQVKKGEGPGKKEQHLWSRLTPKRLRSVPPKTNVVLDLNEKGLLIGMPTKRWGKGSPSSQSLSNPITTAAESPLNQNQRAVASSTQATTSDTRNTDLSGSSTPSSPPTDMRDTPSTSGSGFSHRRRRELQRKKTKMKEQGKYKW